MVKQNLKQWFGFIREADVLLIYFITKKTMKAVPFRPKKNQRLVIESILKHYNKKHNTVALITGKYGSGKSYIAHLLATKLNKRIVHMCDNINQTRPNEFFVSMYGWVRPSEEEPLIVLIDEVDIIINQIANGNRINHKEFKCEFITKADWNRFFEWFNKGLYPHTIILMTSNKSKQQITSLPNVDPSWLRKGRIDLEFNL